MGAPWTVWCQRQLKVARSDGSSLRVNCCVTHRQQTPICRRHIRAPPTAPLTISASWLGRRNVGPTPGRITHQTHSTSIGRRWRPQPPPQQPLLTITTDRILLARRNVPTIRPCGVECLFIRRSHLRLVSYWVNAKYLLCQLRESKLNRRESWFIRGILCPRVSSLNFSACRSTCICLKHFFSCATSHWRC